MVVVIVILLLKLFPIFSFFQFCSTSAVSFFLFFFLINVIGLNNHLIPWPGPRDYNYPVARWFFILGLFKSRFQTIEESAS